ncbi:alpha/beta hydrolase [Fulvimarina sp. 2208YS6-2-32]|uniref:Alpha/beta hydrolase n=1 Tax=Fulvimarina uroteuthidis TaxID=3098149 RepID=A0ABU5I5X4_9HYPH|nr:alpha/beta hydrolase [Fulvimarina sp. 2208YS6-2-32]MDY8110214.1 alpha/beta hydrolase [Fulvimarina sp. 2208YS6-2-32]
MNPTAPTEASAGPLGHHARFVPATADGLAPLLALHGTGGDENDLLPLAAMVAPGAAILSPRGAVLENGMPRFFRRLAEGVFDEADIVRRANDLADFVEESRSTLGLARPIALGFSNGANIAAAMLLLRPEVLAGAILIRAMVPLKEPPSRADGTPADRPVLILSGAMDPIVPSDNAARLARQLALAGAAVTHEILPAGHGLTQADIGLATSFLREHGTLGAVG